MESVPQVNVSSTPAGATNAPEDAPPATPKSFTVEAYWRSPPSDFSAANCARFSVSQGTPHRTYYLEIPAGGTDILRLDLGSEPALWLIESLACFATTSEGALREPPLAIANAANDFAGLQTIRGTALSMAPQNTGPAVCRAFCWDNDPQVMLTIPAENRGIAGTSCVIALTCTVVDPLSLIMDQSGAQLLARIGEGEARAAALEARAVDLEGRVADLKRENAILHGTARQLADLRNSRAHRFSQSLSRLYHGVFGKSPGGSGSAGP